MMRENTDQPEIDEISTNGLIGNHLESVVFWIHN